MAAKSWNVRNYLVGVGVSLVVAQVVSFVVSQFSDIEVIPLGWSILLLASVVALSALYSLGTKIGDLDSQDILFAGIVLGGVVLFYYFVPQFTPEAFSIVPKQLNDVISSGVVNP